MKSISEINNTSPPKENIGIFVLTKKKLYIKAVHMFRDEISFPSEHLAYNRKLS